jgi:anti-sigma factor RsiW
MADRSADLTCAEAVELVTDYLEGALPEPLRERFERHLAGCEACDSYLDQVRHTVATVGRLALDGVPDAVRSRLQRVFRDWKAAR